MVKACEKQTQNSEWTVFANIFPDLKSITTWSSESADNFAIAKEPSIERFSRSYKKLDLKNKRTLFDCSQAWHVYSS